MDIHVSLAAFPGLSVEHAMVEAAGAVEPCIGALLLGHTQLCPQNRGQLDEAVVDRLREFHPHTRFRLHANVHVQQRRVIRDWSDFADDVYWRRLAELSRRLDAPAYSAHAGRRDQATLKQVFESVRKACDLFGDIPCAVEGHYPTPEGRWLIDSWEEYAQLLTAGVPYALDLSHLNIVAHHSGRREMNLVRDLLANENAIEIHTSGNTGRADQHHILVEEPWWMECLTHTNAGAVIFSEGNQLHA